MGTEAQKPVLTITNFGGISPELAPADLPAGLAVIAENVEFDFIGAVSTRAGLQSEVSYVNLFGLVGAGDGATLPGQFTPNEIPWVNPEGVVGSGSPPGPATVTLTTSTQPVSQQLVVSNFNTNILLGAQILGLSILIDGFQDNQQAPAYIIVSLTSSSALPGGSPSFKTQLPQTQGRIVVGGPVETFGYKSTVNPKLFNDPTFGVSIVAHDDDGFPATFTVSGVHLQTWLSAAPPASFDYVKSFEMTDATTLTLALDSAGTLWQEDIDLTPNQLAPVVTTILPNTFAVSQTLDDREFLALSDLRAGTNQPLTYNGTSVVRLSQVGPGAPPNVGQSQNEATLTAAANASGGNTAYTGTFTPTIPVGIAVTISGFLTPANDGTFTVISCNATTLVVNNPAGVLETDAAIASYSGNAEAIISITQAGKIDLRRIYWGAQLGTFENSGNVLTFFGAGRVPDQRTPSIGFSLPGLFVGATIFITTAGNLDVDYPNIDGEYTVLQISVADVGNGEIAPCFSVTARTNHSWASKDTTDFGHSPTPTGPFFLAQYQTTQSTITVNNPIPNLGAGNNIVIAGTSTVGYNGSWNLTGELNGGQMSITSDVLLNNIATFTYTSTQGQAPGWQPAHVYILQDRIIDQHGFVQQVTQAGTSGGSIPNFSQTVGATTNDPTGADVVWTNRGTPGSITAGAGFQVTVTGATNGSTSSSNPFNVTDAQIISATATTFTVGVKSHDVPPGAESGTVAVINGTIFTFDTTKLLSNSTGGTVLQQGGLGAGTRQCVVMFLTDDGSLTQASPPLQFNLSANAEAIIVSQVPIGPSNVVARVVAFTESGQQGVPGAFFYYIPQAVTTVSPFNANQQITYSSTIILNNTQTTSTFAFTDAILLKSTEIDIQGANNFNQVELGASLGIIAYGNRLCAYGTNAKVNNLDNYSFDGGSAGSVAAIAGSVTYKPVLAQTNRGQSVTSTSVYSSTKVQSATNSILWNSNNSTNLVTTFAVNCTVGNTIIAGFTVFDWDTWDNVTDNLGNNWSLAAVTNNGQLVSRFYYWHVTQSGIKSVNLGQSGHHGNSVMVGNIVEMTGFLVPLATDGIASNTTNAATLNTGTITTHNANDVIFSHASRGFSGTIPAGFTFLSEINSPPNAFGGFNIGDNLAYQVTSATGTFSPNWTNGSNAGSTVAFKLNPVTTIIFGQTTLAVPFLLSVAAGDTIVATCEAFDYTGTPVVTDSLGSTYTQRSVATNGTSKSYIFSAIAAATGACTVTVSTSGPHSDSYMISTIMDWQGFLSVVALDGVGTNFGTFTGSASSGEVDTTMPSDLIISSIFNQGGVLTQPAGYTLVSTQANLPGTGTIQSAYFVNPTMGSFNPVWTRPGALVINGASVAFQVNPIIHDPNPGGGGHPLGWGFDPVFGPGGSIQPSPLFGFSYTITNSSTGSPPGPAAVVGMITQNVFHDQFIIGGGAPVIAIQQQYRIRITAANVSADTTGNLVVDLFSASTGLNGTIYPGAAIIPLGSIPATMTIFDTTLLTSIFPTFVPSDLVIRIYGTNFLPGAKVYVDRIEPYLAHQPLVDGGSSFLCSYKGNFTAFDFNTGRLGMATENQQPIRCAFTLFDQLVGVKSHSMYSTTDNGTSEPGLWTVREISNRVGTLSCHGVAVGEGWAVIADQAGLFLWDGGQPAKISGEIQPLWDSINWKFGNTIWVTNDPVRKRIYIGAPIPTPNESMPDFPLNANPTTPNVVLMLSYRELNTASSIMQEGAMRQTFAGTLKAYILGRKWSAWAGQFPYADLCDRPDNTQQMLFCNGVGNSKIYRQLTGVYDDDGLPILSRYMSYGMPKSDEAEAKQMGLHRYLALFGTWLVTGSGLFNISTYPDFPNSPRVAVSTPQVLQDPPPYGDLELPINRSGFRFFIDMSTNAVGSFFKLSRLNVSVSKEPYSPTRGFNG